MGTGNCQNEVRPGPSCVWMESENRETACNLSCDSSGAIHLVGDRISHWPENLLAYTVLCYAMLAHERYAGP